jgi:hypothetical protein
VIRAGRFELGTLDRREDAVLTDPEGNVIELIELA